MDDTIQRAWLSLGANILHSTSILNSKKFQSFFKLEPQLVQLVWVRLNAIYPNSVQQMHLLWCLHYLKTTNTNEEHIATTLSTNRRTLRIHVLDIHKASCRNSLTIQFDFGRRFKDWDFLVPSCLCDTMFVKITRPYLKDWEYYNSGKNAYGIWFQIVCSLGKPFRILSFEGPFKGAAADVSIFRSTVLPLLLPNEKVMCDKGYKNEERCWCPPEGKIGSLSLEDKIKRREVTAIRHTVERAIGRMRVWGVMQRRWSEDLGLITLCATVVAKLTQLDLYIHPLTVYCE